MSLQIGEKEPHCDDGRMKQLKRLKLQRKDSLEADEQMQRAQRGEMCTRAFPVESGP